MIKKKGVTGRMPYNSILLGWHYRKVLREAVKLAELNGNETILDFGCQTQQLKEFLPKETKYIGYDVVPEWSNVKKYWKHKTDIVFCLNVLEHLTEKELRTALRHFREMNAYRIVIALPNDNFFQRFFEFVFGYDAENAFEHLLSVKEIALFLSREFGLPFKTKRIDCVQYLAVYGGKIK